ncbi:MAG TPA: hypothetical protein VN081_05515 [Dongiaceae bacterium]|nr:hypothetical protein [Dongiaceae bacterium]
MYDRVRHTPEAAFPPNSDDVTPVFNDEYPALDIKWLKKQERRFTRRRRFPLKFGAAAIITSSLLHAYLSDVYENEQREQSVQVSLKSINDNPESTSSNAFIAGFNSLDANFLTRKLGPAVMQVSRGDLDSVNVGDAPPNPKAIAEKIIEHAKENNLDEVSLFGYSLGGIETIKAAVQIAENSGIRIKAIYLASTPHDIESLYPDRRNLLSGLTTALSWVPYSEHSTYVQFLLTLGFNIDDFMPGSDLADRITHFDGQTFWSDAQYQWDTAWEHKSPSVATLEYQIDLARTDVRSDIKQLAEATQNNVTPTIVYLRIARPGLDYVVENDKASSQYCDDAREVHIPCIIVSVRGSSHDEYYTTQSVNAYNDALRVNKNEIVQSFKRQEDIFASKQANIALSHLLADAQTSTQPPATPQPFDDTIQASGQR